MALPDFALATEATRLGNSDTLRSRIVTFAGDAAYATGGSSGFLTKVRKVLGHDIDIAGIIALASGGYVLEYTRATDKLLIRQSAGSAAPLVEVANAADLSGTTFVVAVLYF